MSVSGPVESSAMSAEGGWFMLLAMPVTFSRSLTTWSYWSRVMRGTWLVDGRPGTHWQTPVHGGALPPVPVGMTVPPVPRGEFPATPAVSTAPALTACCAAAGKKCAPAPALWTDPSWQALKFSMDDPHYYAYTYLSSGTDLTSAFTARANGDLDCDTTYSTFEMVGSIQADGTVTGQAGFFKDRELE